MKTSMKQLSFAFAISAGIGCENPPIHWPDLVTCAPAGSEVLEIVATVLRSEGDWRAALEDIAREHGPEAVVCAVSQLTESVMAASQEQAGASLDEIQVMSRAEEFLVGKRVRYGS